VEPLNIHFDTIAHSIFGCATMQRMPASFLPPITFTGETPKYRQLSDWFRGAIMDGRLRPGQRLPSTRSLASELRTSRIPVQSAYEQLVAEGYLETFVGAGTCVARTIPQQTLNTIGASARRFPLLIKGSARRVSRRSARLHTGEQTWLESFGAFRHGVPALDQFPIGLWAKLVHRSLRTSQGDILAHGDAMGYLPLRKAIAEYLGVTRSVRCDASQILITNGSQQGLLLCAHVLLDVNERVWMEDPGYPGAHQAFRAAGARMVPVPVDREGLSVAVGSRRGPDARAVYVTPSHQLPLGITMSAARRMSLLNWAQRHGAWVIEDDYDSEYRFESRPITSLQGLDADSRVIYVGTFSKVMFPALRLGHLVLPRALIAAFAAARHATDTYCSITNQLAMTEFIRQGHLARHIRRMRALYRQRRIALVEAIQEHLGDQLEVVGDEAGTRLVALLPRGVDDVSVGISAAQRGISARPLSSCYLRRPQRGGLILGYGNTELGAIQDGVRKLKASILGG
jgi:GntR family transcriptional regulator / MocR family aminotransferase